MLKQRILVVITLIPIGIVLIFAGGWVYNIAVILILAGAAWEFGQIFKHGGYHPAELILIGGTAVLALVRGLSGFGYSDLILAAVVMGAMAWHVFSYERGQDCAAVDFAITTSGVIYLGWLGSYFISVRSLPDGVWWIMLALPAIWIADGAAYEIGRRFGRHKMSRRVSPNKSWEGYIAGLVAAVPLTGLLAMAWGQYAPALTFQRGMILGLVVALLAPLGDLGESLIKRQFGLKDSGRLLPGHGGVMDRIDSWLWTGVISFYMITWFW